MSSQANKWIESGYEILASEGPENIQVERLARLIGLNKSGFYHHFGDREIFMVSLLKYHVSLNESFYQEALAAKQFDPDILKLIIKYRDVFLVQRQLRKFTNIPEIKTAFAKVQKRNEKVYITLWAAHINLEESPDLSAELWYILRDLAYLRMDKHSLSYESISSLVQQYTSVIKVLLQYFNRK